MRRLQVCRGGTCAMFLITGLVVACSSTSSDQAPPPPPLPVTPTQKGFISNAATSTYIGPDGRHYIFHGVNAVEKLKPFYPAGTAPTTKTQAIDPLRGLNTASARAHAQCECVGMTCQCPRVTARCVTMMRGCMDVCQWAVAVVLRESRAVGCGLWASSHAPTSPLALQRVCRWRMSAHAC